MDNRKFGALSSSEDPQKLATSVTGIIKVVGGLIAYLGVSQVAGDINTFAEQAGMLVTAGYAFYGIAETCFGLGRKIVIAVYTRFR